MVLKIRVFSLFSFLSIICPLISQIFLTGIPTPRRMIIFSTGSVMTGIAESFNLVKHNQGFSSKIMIWGDEEAVMSQQLTTGPCPWPTNYRLNDCNWTISLLKIKHIFIHNLLSTAFLYWKTKLREKCFLT